jgi:hemerythrin-like domain-containing protein
MPHDPSALYHLLSMYIRMYEPHSAREDTVIFPGFRQLVSPNRFNRSGEKFEEIEEQKFSEKCS